MEASGRANKNRLPVLLLERSAFCRYLAFVMSYPDISLSIRGTAL